MTAKTAEDRLRYAKQYASILTSVGMPTELLQLSPNKRIHVMKALSSLARFTGRSDDWQQIRQKHGLQWSTGTEKIDAFTRFFDQSKNLDTMIDWLRQAMQALPRDYSNFLLFCTLTGMRGSEAVESVRLLNQPSGKFPEDYYNPEQQKLQHYLFPDIFIRRTKAIYVSVVNDAIIGIAKNISKTPTQNGLKKALVRRRYLSMKVKYCRKIYASYLRQSGIESEIIDMLSGRVGKNIFLRHYYRPGLDYKERY